MASTYGRAKQCIKRARFHIAGITGQLDWMEEEYSMYPSIKKWFDTFKPSLMACDEFLILLLLILENPAPYDAELKEQDNGKSSV